VAGQLGPGEVERLLAKDSAAASEHDRQLSGFHFDLGEGAAQSWRSARLRQRKF